MKEMLFNVVNNEDSTIDLVRTDGLSMISLTPAIQIADDPDDEMLPGSTEWYKIDADVLSALSRVCATRLTIRDVRTLVKNYVGSDTTTEIEPIIKGLSDALDYDEGAPWQEYLIRSMTSQISIAILSRSDLVLIEEDEDRKVRWIAYKSTGGANV